MAKAEKKPARGARGEYIIIRVTAEEKALIEEASEAKTIDRSSWGRMHLVEKAKEELKR